MEVVVNFFLAVGFVGLLLCFWGVQKINGGQTFKGLAILILGMVLILPVSVLHNMQRDFDAAENETKSQSITQEVKQQIKAEAFERIVEQPTRTETVAPTGEHWISDGRGVYLWNPEPQDGESITWSGGHVQEGNYKFADGSGTLTWYRDGEVIQVDHGTFRRGRHHGQFTHEFPSGRIDYSNWNNGVEIP